MELEKALFNWLQIELVSKARPEDKAAKETAEFFKEILLEDHNITDLSFDIEKSMYNICFVKDGEKKIKQFLRILVDKLLEDIEGEPKYN